MVTIRLPKREAGLHSRADFHCPSRDSNFRGKLTQWSQRRPTAMKTLRIELWTSLLIFAFFPALAQAQNVFSLYAGAAPTPYKITFDQNAPNFGGGANYKDKTAKSTYTPAHIGLTWVSPKGIYGDLAPSQRLSATHHPTDP